MMADGGIGSEVGFELFAVTADKGIRAWGRDLAEVFAAAARGLTSLIVDPTAIRPQRVVPVEVTAGDREALLVAWLNELLYLFETQGLLAADCEITEISEARLAATVRGESLDPSRHVLIGHVKAATYHQLRIAQTQHGWEARVVVDV